jgi:N-acetylmuramoyl-L-alanine amidase
MVDLKKSGNRLTPLRREMFNMKIEWRGNAHTNKSSREGHIPIAIVNHITAGSGESADNWFRSPGNEVSSAHFLVWEDGRITQYVDIREMAWANGLTKDRIPYAKSELVRSNSRLNPNKYTISIEHAGKDGSLTPAQLEATVWLHKWIREQVKKIYRYEIPFNRRHILGHFEIDPKRKPNCPGPKFPWDELMKRLNSEDSIKYTSQSSVLTSILKKGHKGPEVKQLQENLIKLGFSLPKYGADGDFGGETEVAVKKFQQKYGLKDDGIVGPLTRQKIKESLQSLQKQKTQKPANQKVLYKIQVGAFSKKENADKLKDELNKKGYEAIVVKDGKYWKVQTGAFSNPDGAKRLSDKLTKDGYKNIIKKESK